MDRGVLHLLVEWKLMAWAEGEGEGKKPGLPDDPGFSVGYSWGIPL